MRPKSYLHDFPQFLPSPQVPLLILRRIPNIQNTNAVWLNALQSSGEQKQVALAYFRVFVLRWLKYNLSKWILPAVDGTQKLRLLIYTELHIITSDMLFVATEGIGWKKVKVEKV